MIAGPPVLCELYAGTAAVSRWCLGLPLDLVSWLGAKRRVAGELACALELGDRPTLGGLLLCDAGPWGWVWPALLDEPTRAAVVAVLRRWASTCPACEGAASDGCPVCQRARTPGGGPDASDLWAWLASQPPRADLAERVSQQLWLQARSASGAAVWWDEARWSQAVEGRVKQAGERNSGWRKGQSGGRPDTIVGQQGDGSNNGRPERLDAWRMGHARGGREHVIGETSATHDEPKQDRRRRDGTIDGWRMMNSAGREFAAGQKGPGPDDGRWLAQHGQGGPQEPRERDTLRSASEGWTMCDGRGVPRVATEKGRGVPRRARGIVRTETLAERVELLGGAAWPSGDPAFGELIASWLVLQTGSARGRPVELQDHGWRTYGYAHLSRGAVARGFTSRLHLPRVAGRVEALAGAPWPSTAVLHGRVQEAFWLARELGPRARVLLDPPYHRDGDQDRDRTGYGQDCPLSETLAMADELARAGPRGDLRGRPAGRGPRARLAQLRPHEPLQRRGEGPRVDHGKRGGRSEPRGRAARGPATGAALRRWLKNLSGLATFRLAAAPWRRYLLSTWSEHHGLQHRQPDRHDPQDRQLPRASDPRPRLDAGRDRRGRGGRARAAHR